MDLVYVPSNMCSLTTFIKALIHYWLTFSSVFGEGAGCKPEFVFPRVLVPFLPSLPFILRLEVTFKLFDQCWLKPGILNLSTQSFPPLSLAFPCGFCFLAVSLELHLWGSEETTSQTTTSSTAKSPLCTLPVP